MVSFTVFKGSKSGEIVQSSTTREIKRDEVLIKVTHSGVCGTDEHYRHNDIVLGHEGMGIVEDTGSEVKSLRKGDLVGWGYIHNSCGECKHCLTGFENLCPNFESFGAANLDQGSFATYGIWKASYVFKIPDSISPEHAAPLMCGGATVFHSLRSFQNSSTDRVGIVGIGGLGHLAIQFASKMGCEVVVFSSTESKREEAMQLGATQFVVTKGEDELDIGKPLDRLLVTTSAQPDWAKFLPVMAPHGSIYPLTVSADDLRLPYNDILFKELRIQGSLVAPRQVHKEMIDFAALHGIRPVVQIFPMTVGGITKAMTKLRAGEIRYRAVLVVK